jgi:hypothetical protein
LPPPISVRRFLPEISVMTFEITFNGK